MKTIVYKIKAIHYLKWLLIGALLLMGGQCFAVDVQAQGLFKGGAILLINGKQQMLKTGKRSPEGVLLVYADTQRAMIEVDGKRQELTLSKQISSSYQAVEKVEVVIPRNAVNQYITNATINGKRIKVLVDTGATSVAMSSVDAKRLGIDYKKGTASRVVTASGQAKAYGVTLDRVALGAISVGSVTAVVIEGEYPATVLLGMIYLNHVNMREQSGTMYLTKKF